MALVIPTASTLFPSATWWQTLANSITADINAARAEALAKSATSGTLASGAVVSSTMAPGLYAAPSVAGITGLPTGAGPGGLLVTPAMMRYVEEGAGGRWWERKKDGTVWLGWARAKATKLVPHALTRPQAATTETQTSRSVRIPFQVPVRARRWRVTIRNANYRTNTAYPGAVTLDTLVIGSAKRDEVGALTSSFAPSVTFPSGNRILTRATAVADLGAGYTFSNGVDMLEPGVDYMLAFGYTTTGQDVHLGMGGGWWTLGKPGNAELTNDATALLQLRMPFDVRLELLTDDDLPVDVVIGDSISAGSNATLPVHQAPARYMGRNAGRATALHTFGGAAFNEWIGVNWGDATSMKWLDVTAYGRADRAVVALGSNDINSGTDLTTLQANFRALVALVRERVSPNVVACTVTPRTAWTGTAKETLRQAFNSWLRAFPEGVVAVADLAAAVEDAAGTAPRSDFVATDGIHFNTAGSTALGAALAGAASAGGKGPKGDKGDKGDPGGSDAATASWINTGAQTQAAGDARWVVKANRPYNALDYLTADGVTDEGTALYNLIQSMPAGAVLDLPSHKTILASRILTLPRAITIRGGSIRNTVSGPCFWVRASDTTIEGTKITLNGTGTYDANVCGIRANGTQAAPFTGVKIRDVTINDSQASGLRLEWVTGATVERVNVKGFCYMGIQVLSGNDVAITRANISGVVHQASIGNSYGISISDTLNTDAARSRFVTVSKCTVDGMRDWVGIETHGGYGVRVVDNTLTNCASGIAMASGDSSRVTSPERVTVLGNYMDFGTANVQRGGLRLQGKTGSGAASGILTNNTVIGYATPTIFTDYDAAKSVLVNNVTV